jgi:hypothetical protein
MFEQLFNGKQFVEPKDLEAAKIMSKTMQWLERENGRLKYYRVGSKKVLYAREHLAAYFEQTESGGAENEK